jgi:hypothetical protein
VLAQRGDRGVVTDAVSAHGPQHEELPDGARLVDQAAQQRETGDRAAGADEVRAVVLVVDEVPGSRPALNNPCSSGIVPRNSERSCR